MNGVEPDKRRLEPLAPVRVVRRTGRERGLDLAADAAEALGEDRVVRRHVVHVVDEEPRRHKTSLATRPEHLDVLRRKRTPDAALLEDAVDVAAGNGLRAFPDAPAAVHARLEIERRAGQDVGDEMPPHREIRFAAEVQDVRRGCAATKASSSSPIAFTEATCRGSLQAPWHSSG